MNYLEFDFETEEATQVDMLIALLSEESFIGFEEEDNYLKAFVQESAFNEISFQSVIDKFEKIIYTRHIIEQENWNLRWEQGFQPVIIEDFAGIRAGFHEPLENVQHEIIITPKMSFGTGHHATTFLMIQLMKDVDFVGKQVIDYGTGTGVLAILAEKLGAENIEALDIDEYSILNTNENIERNDCSRIEVKLADHLQTNKEADVILANINLNVILSSLADIKCALVNDGTVMLSGFLKENEDQMSEALKTSNLEIISVSQKGDWIAMICKNGSK